VCRWPSETTLTSSGRSGKQLSFTTSRTCMLYFVVCFLLGNYPVAEFCMLTFQNALFHLHRRLWRSNRQSVPKCRHIEFRRRGITHKKAYKIQNKAKVWNQECCTFLILAHKSWRNITRYLLQYVTLNCPGLEFDTVQLCRLIGHAAVSVFLRNFGISLFICTDKKNEDFNLKNFWSQKLETRINKLVMTWV
jgi:hypothetical protein